MKSKKTKKALSGSILALVLCFVMLIGTTFAWFTSSDSTAVNTIQAGTLKVALEMKNSEGKWVDATGETLNFVKDSDAPADEQLLWEPGATYTLPAVRVINEGNLALKYKVVITAVNGDSKLAEVLNVSVATRDKNGTEATKNGFTLKDVLGANYDTYMVGNLTANQAEEITISMTMDTKAGNEYQGKSIEGIAVTVVAAQDTVEWDSTTNQYDAGAEYAAVITNNEELKTALESNAETIDLTLTSDVTIDISGYRNLPLGDNTKSICIDGGGQYTLTFNHEDSDANDVTTANDVTLVLKNLKLTNSGHNDGPWNRHDINFDCDVVLENVISDKAIALKKDATLKNVTISDSGEIYGLWITLEGQTVTLDNVTINAERGIAIKDQYVKNPAQVTLNINGGKITSTKKAAVLVTNGGGTDTVAYTDAQKTVGAIINVSGLDISGVSADSTNVAWRDGGSGNTSGNINVTVTGGSVIDEP